MKFRWIAAVIVLALALGAGCLAYVCMREPVPKAAAGEDDALLWLRYEFKLPADKMARITQMHEAYQGVCEEHCRNIWAARATVRKLKAAQAAPSDISAAEAKSREVDLVCTTSLENHVREIAGVIGGTDGERYLAMVLPRVAHFEHTGAPKLDLNNTTAHDHAHH